MTEVGLAPQVVHHDRFVDETEHFGLCRALLSAPDRPTAVIVYSERDISVLMAAGAALRLAVPTDLSVVAFAPVEPWVAGQHVSVIAVPTAEIGRRAVDMLLRKVASPDSTCPPEPVPYGPAFRATVAAPPRARGKGSHASNHLASQ